jgi:GalNAc-alpha-(1->4)-GalNAc-alpha-(1->3)-diNAcBac-PP-undecaprenol alpha-1,4-N-acetyl-D-galactosaminyltransferase
MKILFIINHLSAGGAEKVLTVLANTLSKKGINVCIATISQNAPFYALSDEISLLHIPVKRASSSLLNRILAPFSLLFGIKKVIEEVQPDVTISFTTTMNVYSIIASKMTPIPLIVSEHTNFYNVRNGLWRRIRDRVYPFADTLVVLTDHDKEKYSFVKNVVRIYNPLRLEEKHKYVEREQIVLAVGRLYRVKGFDLLLKSFARLNQSGWHLVILGEGEERTNLQSLAKELRISDQVEMPGTVKDVEIYYKKASIFVLSSRAEGFPGALCEAMGYGCAVVAYDCITGPRDIITDGTDGLLVRPENIDDLAKSIQSLIDNPDKREALSLNAKKIAARLDEETIAEEWLKTIDALLAKKAGE